MPNWSASMEQTFEYYTVDPGTWKDDTIVATVTSSSITRDLTADTLGSLTIDLGENIGETYIRIYLVVVQNGVRERFPLGTYLIQTQSITSDGMFSKTSFDGYTPLLELKEKQPPLGYYVAKEENVMDMAYAIANTNMRGPVVPAKSDVKVFKDFVANANDTWVTFISDLISNAKFHLDLDEMGRVLFAPDQKLDSMQPVWTYTDDNSSILYPDITYEKDLYGIPNVVEVIYSDANDRYYSRVVNDDPNSIVSTINRGREIPYVVTNPSFSGVPTQPMVDEYATQLLEALSTVSATISYTHGYNNVRIGDCIRLNYNRAGITGIKARVTKQTIKCESGCSVQETAIFDQKLWG